MHVNTCLYACVRTCVRAYMRTFVHTCVHVCTFVRAHMRTCTRAFAHRRLRLTCLILLPDFFAQCFHVANVVDVHVVRAHQAEKAVSGSSGLHRTETTRGRS